VEEVPVWLGGSILLRDGDCGCIGRRLVGRRDIDVCRHRGLDGSGWGLIGGWEGTPLARRSGIGGWMGGREGGEGGRYQIGGVLLARIISLGRPSQTIFEV